MHGYKMKVHYKTEMTPFDLNIARHPRKIIVLDVSTHSDDHLAIITRTQLKHDEMRRRLERLSAVIAKMTAAKRR